MPDGSIAGVRLVGHRVACDGGDAGAAAAGDTWQPPLRNMLTAGESMSVPPSARSLIPDSIRSLAAGVLTSEADRSKRQSICH